MTFPRVNNSELERLCNVLGDTSTGFSGSEIGRLLSICSIPDDCSNGTKRIRLYNSLANRCNSDKNSNCVYQLIQEAMMPSRWMDNPNAREEMRVKINEVIILKGIELNEKNQYVSVKIAETLSEAKQRASNLNKKLYAYGVHHAVQKCCKEELLVENYFHAVHEAAKSLTARISEETNIPLDGAQLIERAFSTTNPAVVMNGLQTESEKNQHRGLKEMLLGIHYSVRNVTAHELKIKWIINEEDATIMLSIISALHKQLDRCHFLRVN